jgi:hypothetical protein
LGLATLCTGYDDVRHAGCKLEVVESGEEEVGAIIEEGAFYTRMIEADKSPSAVMSCRFFSGSGRGE